MTTDIFISYARTDGAQHASNLEVLLINSGFSTWRDTRGIDPTNDFTSEIERAIENATYVVACVTPDVKRETSFVRREISYALLQGKPVVVARFAEIPPPIAVINHTWIDFYKGFQSSFRLLIDVLRKNGFNRLNSPAPNSHDPYRSYLDALYKQINRYLDRAVISILPDEPKLPLLSLSLISVPDQVNSAIIDEEQSLPDYFIQTAGILKSRKRFSRFAEAFDEYNSRLLLLGHPGAGKTITLMDFARDAIIERLNNPNAPLPIIAPIASWDKYKKPSIEQWLAQIIPALSSTVGTLLADGNTLLILDGLDELGKTGHSADTETDSKTEFIRLLPQNNALVISSRTEDYSHLGVKLRMGGCVELELLSESKIAEYLRPLPNLSNLLADNPDLKNLTRTPLLLSLYAYAFAIANDSNPSSINNLTTADLQDRILETYVDRRLQHEVRTRGETEFSRESIYEILGQVAIKTFRSVLGNGLPIHFFSSDKEKAFEIISIAQRLNLIRTELRPNLWEFSHSLLRDYFAARFAYKHIAEQRYYSDPMVPSPAYVLGVLHDRRALSLLLNVFPSDDLRIGAAAADAIAIIGEFEVWKQLVPYLTDKRWHVRSNALKILGTLKCEPAINYVLPLAGDTDELVRIEVATTLGLIRSNEGISTLGLLLEDENSSVREQAAQAFGNFTDNRVLPYLERALFNPHYMNEGVRRLALQSLQRIGSQEAYRIITDWRTQHD